MNEEVESEKLEHEEIKNRYELIAWMYKEIKKKLEVDFHDLAQKRKSFQDYVDEKTSEINRQQQVVRHVITLINDHKNNMEASHRALNDRTNNLQRIYNKMISIENQLKPFKEMSNLFQNTSISDPFVWEKIPVHNIEIEEYDFTVRTVNALRNVGIKTVEDLIKLKKEELLKYPNFGRKSLREVVDELARHGLKLAE